MTDRSTAPASQWARGDPLVAALSFHVNRLVTYIDRHTPPDLRRLIDPQDVVQDTLFDAARAADRFQPDGRPDPEWRWLVTIARNRLVNLIHASHAVKRGGGAKPLGEDELFHGSVVALLQDLAVFRHTPSRSATRREMLAALERSLERLPPDYRDAVRLRYLEGLSLREAAHRLSRTEDSTQKLCVRGLQALRAELRSLSLYV